MNRTLRQITKISTALLTMIAAAWLLTPLQTQAKPQTQRYVAPPAWILGPIQGWGGSEEEVNAILDNVEKYRLPLTAFHFDYSTWEVCNNNAQFGFSETLLDRLRAKHLRAIFWIVPIIDKSCSEYNVALSHGYFVKDANGQTIVTSNWEGTGSWIDFGNPNAVAYWHSLLDKLVARTQGVIGGFYTDDLRPDLTNDTAYADAYNRDLLDYIRARVPDGDVIMKRYGANTASDPFLAQYAHTSYVNDLDADFAGLREGIRRVFDSAKLYPAPFNEFSGYTWQEPDAVTYIRRMHWGAFQAVMDESPYAPTHPWNSQYPPEVMQAYRYYTNLHWELVPYLHSYDQLAYETGAPIFRDSDATRYSTLLGNEIFVRYVTRRTSSVGVLLPPGEWINYWDEQQVFAGAQTITLAVPLGREPIFIRNGAILPMQVRRPLTGHGTRRAAGSLTVNVFPKGQSAFKYFDVNGRWVNLTARQNGASLTLCTQPEPSQSVIYRVARWSNPPQRVSTTGGAVGVNTSWGTELPELEGEATVDGSQGGWYYDAARQHLIVKLTSLGSACPPSRETKRTEQ